MGEKRGVVKGRSGELSVIEDQGESLRGTQEVLLIVIVVGAVVAEAAVLMMKMCEGANLRGKPIHQVKKIRSQHKVLGRRRSH